MLANGVFNRFFFKFMELEVEGLSFLLLAFVSQGTLKLFVLKRRPDKRFQREGKGGE